MMDSETVFCRGEPKNFRVAGSTGTFSGEASAEKRPETAFEEILNRLYGQGKRGL